MGQGQARGGRCGATLSPSPPPPPPPSVPPVPPLSGHEAARRSGLAEHLQRPSLCHRGDGQGDPAHLRRQQERHGAAQAGYRAGGWPSMYLPTPSARTSVPDFVSPPPHFRDHPCAGAGAGVLGRDRAQRPHVTAAPRPPRAPPVAPQERGHPRGSPPPPNPPAFINKGRAASPPL